MGRSVVGIVVGILMGLLSGQVEATVYVSVTDPTCGGQTPCFTDIQSAVDSATSGETIKVAAGTYTGVEMVDVGGVTYYQVVFIDDSLSLEGGYTTTNWTTPDPAINVTIIDAESTGRCVSVVGSASETVTVAGMTLTGGDYSDLGNPDGVGNEECPRTGGDCGAGFYGHNATIHLRDCLVTGNVVSTTNSYSDGAGAILYQTTAGSTIQRTRFVANNASNSGSAGGGLTVRSTADVTISDCVFQTNTASTGSAGMDVFQNHGVVEVEDTDFLGNELFSAGAGAVKASLTMAGTALRITRSEFRSNQGVDHDAAALHFSKAGSGDTVVEMANCILADNTVRISGDFEPVIQLIGGSGGEFDLAADHLTLADHPGMSTLVVVALYDEATTATLRNTLVDGAGNAFVGGELDTGEATVHHTNTLTNAVGTLHLSSDGTPTFSDVGHLSADPMLNDDHRLTFGSHAIDAGVDAGVTDDVDGISRPVGAGFDIGAHEFSEIFSDGFESGNTDAW